MTRPPTSGRPGEARGARPAAARPPALRVLGRVVVPPRPPGPEAPAPGAPAPASPSVTTRVLVALASAAARHGARSFLDAPGLDAAVLPASGEAVLAAVRARPPVVLLLSSETRGPDAFEVLGRLRAEAPAVRAVLLTDGERPPLALRALAAGAAGALDASAGPEAFRRAVRRAARGERVLSDRVRDALVDAHAGGSPGAPHAGLTLREFQTLRGVARGLSTTEIADDLGVAPSTVRSHKAAVRDKLGLSGDAAMARYAVDHGLD